ncbi:MAG TPA: hypothetical protein IAC84_07225 [Firmicutes bacterium]|nr:hypothetical protein [Bacillota bacterium]
MGPVFQKFRSALGGFNREDVARYIEQSATAHREQVAGLEKRLAQAEQERDSLRRELEEVRDERGGLAAEEARVRSSLEESTRGLTKLRGELTQTETKLSVARAELERMQAKVAELSPMAEQYEQLKDRVATVELDAHRKAQVTLDEAKSQADQLREGTREWVEQVLAEYDGLRQDLEGLFEKARAVIQWEERARQAGDRADSLRGKAGQP